MNYRMQQKVVIFSFLLVPVSLLLLFLIYPTLQLFRYSFTSWDGYSPSFKYIGFENYVRMLFDFPEAWQAIRNNGVYFLLHTIAIPLELTTAVLLNRVLRGSAFFRFSVLMPYIINGIAVAYMFSYIYNPINGPLNELLKAVGLESWIQSWLSDSNVVNYSLVVVSLWRYSGVHVVLFLAGLQSIPKDLYEAAEIDGANFWQQQRFVTLPGIRRVVEIILFMNVSGALLQYDIPLVMTNGGPGSASSTFGLYSLQTAFTYNNYGLASSMAVMLLLLIIIFSSLQAWIVKDRSEA
ncbi:sugar ABC transporter permease [Paenibacillus sp. CGMCC 1.16610]|uniref:ABC transporter permease subunit n=1 Tax=Paenibacillus anseongense TaxID=2682845 RepID=A0ABW9U8E8_9BACL|nr:MULTISPECIES: sugar ABC transporter permease [Paenibacillus]MBA2940896.1 sugar ABC transporter permease [Paenibacillus sp. CGMCC 1.16610]MVQ34080.1 ABC transporter permease subunit [Paenibacillus anseongense]